MKSKKQLYACLTLEGKTHSTDTSFSVNLLATDWRMFSYVHAADHEWKEEGKWPLTNSLQFFLNSDVKIVKVPHFVELSSSRVYYIAMNDAKFRMYFPDYEHEKPINRTYLFNVSKIPLTYRFPFR